MHFVGFILQFNHVFYRLSETIKQSRPKTIQKKIYTSHYKTMLNLLMAAKVCTLEYPSRAFFSITSKNTTIPQTDDNSYEPHETTS